MKKIISVLAAVIFAVGLVVFSYIGPSKSIGKENLSVESEPGPTVVVATPMVKMSSKAQVIIMGTGFLPGQRVRLLFTTMDGVRADIGYALDREPVANEIGAWVTAWKCSRFIQKKLIKEGAYTITVIDTGRNFLAHAPVAFYAEAKSEEKPKKK